MMSVRASFGIAPRAALLDDVYDELEGTLAEVVYVREYIGCGLLNACVCEARCGVALLSALMRNGSRWTPAEDGHEASAWREILLALHTDSEHYEYKPGYIALVMRELDEFVSLAKPGPRRAMPKPGTFEHLARTACLSRHACRTWAREVGSDRLRGWNRCERGAELVRVAVALGVEVRHIHRALCLALLHVAPARHELNEFLETAADGDMASIDVERVNVLLKEAADDFGHNAGVVVRNSTQGVSALSVEQMFDHALRVVDVVDLRKRIETPAMKVRLTTKGAR